MKLNKKFWKNKKILVTGHTGFKGGWLSMLLSNLNSKVSGYALDPVGGNNFFLASNVKKILNFDFRGNIIDINNFKNCIKKVNPEIIFHLAAQSSVIESFKDSRNTVHTNILGTSNILEILKNYKSVKCLIIITTDKVYQNYKYLKKFDEKSELGGDDIYSSSKACCELLTSSYVKSFFSKSKLKVATVRAGNCFGGGDWTKFRIVKDCLDKFYLNKNLFIRSPEAVRPWQHVIEPLIGYLKLAEKLCSSDGSKFIGPWNFGPSRKQNMKVLNLAKLIKKNLHSDSKIIIKKKDKKFFNKKFKVFESKYLYLDSSKALKKLKWKSNLSIDQSVKLTVDWYKSFKKKENIFNLTKKQINDYLSKFT